jgi:hypothetical protein
MRACCEACERPQPVDWRPGDLCIHCGQAVRQELRCFWCVEWTPAAKYCRGCGAEVVEQRLFGAARMLKDAGTDRFTVPKLLRELDPEQVENFTRIYQRQAAVVERHLSDLRLIESRLRFVRATAAVEDVLVRELPWTPARLKAMAPPPLPAGDELAQVAAIQAGTPIAVTASLAPLARLRLGDIGAMAEVRLLAAMADGETRLDAVRALLDWRVLERTAGSADPDHAVDPGWAEVLAASTDPVEAAALLALAGLPADARLLRQALDAGDADVRFAAALALGDGERLAPALAGQPLGRCAAARRLARSGPRAALAPLLGGDDIAVRDAILAGLAAAPDPAPDLLAPLLALLVGDGAPEAAWEAALAQFAAGWDADLGGVLLGAASDDVKGAALDLLRRRKAPSPDLREALLRLMEVEGGGYRHDRLAGTAMEIVVRDLPPALAARAARASRDASSDRALLWDKTGLPREAVGEVLDAILAAGRFRAETWGLDQAIARGAVAPDFAPTRFAREPSAKQRCELLRLAEKQLGKTGDEGLHRFFWQVVYAAEQPMEVRDAAYWGQLRALRTRGMGPGQTGELTLAADSLTRFFGSPAAFLPRFAEAMANPGFHQGSLRDHLEHLVRYAPDGTGAMLAAHGAMGERIVGQAIALVDGGVSPLSSDGVEFLRTVALEPTWRPRLEQVRLRWKAEGKSMNVWDRLTERCASVRQ